MEFNYELLDERLLSEGKLKWRLIINEVAQGLRLFSVKTSIPIDKKKQINCTIPNHKLVRGKYIIDLEYKTNNRWIKIKSIATFEVLDIEEQTTNKDDLIQVDAIWRS